MTMTMLMNLGSKTQFTKAVSPNFYWSLLLEGKGVGQLGLFLLHKFYFLDTFAPQNCATTTLSSANSTVFVNKPTHKHPLSTEPVRSLGISLN